MNLSKSRYCKGVQCNKILWMDKYKSEEREEIDNTVVLENGTNVGELARELYKDRIDIEYTGDLNQMIEDTKAALENKKAIITEASFVYNNNFCSVDILKKDGNNYEIYEVKSSTHVSDIYLDDISYQYYVLKSLGLNVTKVCVIHINTAYVRHGELELDKLFITKDLTETAISKQKEVKKKIDEINKYMEATNEPNMDIGVQCFSPYECPYFKYCSKHLPENNVFDIKGLHLSKKVDYYKKGIISYEDLMKSDLSKGYKDIIDFELNNKEDIVNLKKIKKFLNTLSYPIYYLDFETFQESVPSYDDIRPYMQIPFQYSLHIENKDGKLTHKEFLAESGTDPRRSLALRLVADIPKDSCVLAYNMSFEKGIIKYLASIYDDLSDHLMNIYDNIKDLMVPFHDKDYYTKDMHGSYSIKYVLPALFPDDKELDYHSLDMVHNGAEASDSFIRMKSLSEEEKEELRKNMLKYCGLDTYAMVKILGKLKDTIK